MTVHVWAHRKTTGLDGLLWSFYIQPAKWGSRSLPLGQLVHASPPFHGRRDEIWSPTKPVIYRLLLVTDQSAAEAVDRGGASARCNFGTSRLFHTPSQGRFHGERKKKQTFTKASYLNEEFAFKTLCKCPCRVSEHATRGSCPPPDSASWSGGQRSHRLLFPMIICIVQMSWTALAIGSPSHNFSVRIDIHL